MQNSNELKELLNAISSCNLQELNKNYDECEEHKEYDREIDLKTSVLKLQELLPQFSTIKSEDLNKVLSLLLILYKELQTNGPWKPKNALGLANDIKTSMKSIFNADPDYLLTESHIYDSQNIFEECMQYLHMRLTSDNFKKYPSLIDVYYIIVKDIKVSHKFFSKYVFNVWLNLLIQPMHNILLFIYDCFLV